MPDRKTIAEASPDKELKRHGPNLPRARRPRIDPETTVSIPRNEMTPTVRSTVTRLMAELEYLKAELSQAHQRVAELETVADEDTLVPILNRRGFTRELERALSFARRYGSELALIYVDLDDFKSINDTYGHAAGDEALRHVANLLTQNVRRSDIAGRLGGDEFAIALQQANLQIAETKSAQLEEVVAKTPLLVDDRVIRVSISAGAASVLDSDGAKQALARADNAMFAQKSHKKRSS